MDDVARTTLVTGRLRLEPVSPEHADALWEATEASLDDLRPWLSWAGEASPETSRAFTEQSSAEWAAGREFVFAMIEEGQAIGTVGVHLRRPDPTAEVGYWVRSDRAGRGLVPEAARAVITWAFQTLGLHRVQLLAGIDNHRSQSVALKLGFRREGALRQAGWSADGPYDCLIFGLLSTDPRPDEDG